MIGYKKCVYFDVHKEGTKVKEALITLEIPNDAKVIRPINVLDPSRMPLRKLRCRAAKVLDIVDTKTKKSLPCAFSSRNITNYFIGGTYLPSERIPKTIFTYIKGEIAVADDLDEDPLAVCSNGIHFFLTEEEALNYRL